MPLFRTHQHHAADALKRISAALARGHGGEKRIDENRELLELLLTEAPSVLCRHPWVIGWIETQDQVFTALHAALVEAGVERERAIPGFPRPWPKDRLEALDAWGRFGSANRHSRMTAVPCEGDSADDAPRHPGTTGGFAPGGTES